jgi:oxygen-independent coproporphyrinogen-3 oxidase
MWPYHPDLLAKPVPRYTSYPTAAQFAPSVDATHFDEALGKLTGDISLYVHIPFCKEICWYCGCNTSVANRHQRVEAYLDALSREIALVAARLPGSCRITQIAFGGGSPNALTPVDFVRLVQTITMAFAPIDAVWSVELDPRRFDAEWARVLGGVGVTRASLGVQTFSPRLQTAIGRVQPHATIAEATTLLREAGVSSLNFDLMYGLPYQMMADLEDSLACTVALGADRIALFGYAHVPHLIPRQRKIDGAALPSQVERFAMAAFGYRYLVDAGYVPIGFDHFARPGDPLAQAARAGELRRNFQGFTDDRADAVIGLGASAISVLPGLIAQNEKNTGRYRMRLSQGRLATSAGIVRTADDRKRGGVIESLLCNGTAEVEPALLASLKDLIQPFAERGLVEIGPGRLQIQPEGLPYARSIAAIFDKYLQQNAGRFSNAI